MVRIQTSFHTGDDMREVSGRLAAQVQYMMGIHTPKLASDEGHWSKPVPNVPNRVAWAGGWHSMNRGSPAPQRTFSRLRPSQAIV